MSLRSRRTACGQWAYAATPLRSRRRSHCAELERQPSCCFADAAGSRGALRHYDTSLTSVVQLDDGIGHWYFRAPCQVRSLNSPHARWKRGTAGELFHKEVAIEHDRHTADAVDAQRFACPWATTQKRHVPDTPTVRGLKVV